MQILTMMISVCISCKNVEIPYFSALQSIIMPHPEMRLIYVF